MTSAVVEPVRARFDLEDCLTRMADAPDDECEIIYASIHVHLRKIEMADLFNHENPSPFMMDSDLRDIQVRLVCVHKRLWDHNYLLFHLHIHSFQE